jgi:hypothetical protein
MQASLAQTIFTYLDVLLSIALGVAFLGKARRKAYPWISSYLYVRAVTAVILWFLLYGPLLASGQMYTKIFFVVHWSSYVISAVLLFLGCLDIYRQALAPLPGLARMGTTVFRWASLASILVTATSFTSITSGPEMIVQIGTQMMRCVGTVELCLLAFLMISMKAIGMSPLSRPFGIALALGFLAASDCIQSFVISFMAQMSSPLQTLFEGIAVLSLALWMAYAVFPEPARKPVTLAFNSTIYRWNEIASALGHKEPQVVVQPAPSFFLVDVEKVVERAFSRTLKGKESES